MNGGGCWVLIWVWTCITLLVDKGKPLSHRVKGHAHGQAQSKDTKIDGWKNRVEWRAYNTYFYLVRTRILLFVRVPFSPVYPYVNIHVFGLCLSVCVPLPPAR